MLDQLRDSGGQFLTRLLSQRTPDNSVLFPLPDFVKQAHAPGEYQGAGSFADSNTKRFPCESAQATYLSALYFLTQKSAALKEMPSFRERADIIESRILAAARTHGILPQVEAIKVAVQRGQAKSDKDLPDECFAFLGQSGRHLPIRNSGEVKAAASYIKTHYQAFTFDQRCSMANRILKRAEALQMTDDFSDLEKQAGRGSCSQDHLAQALFERAQLARVKGDLEAANALGTKAADVLEDSTSILPSNLLKMAAALEVVDRRLNATEANFIKPESLFSITVKVAQAALDDNVFLTNGSVYSLQSLSKVAQHLDGLGDLFGRDLVDSLGAIPDMAKLAQELKILPANDADMFDRFAQQISLPMVHKEASGRLDLSDWAALHASARQR